MKKGISQLLTILLLISILIGIAIIVGGISGEIVRKQSPKGSVLQLTRFTWAYSNNTIWIHGLGYNIGYHRINITNAYVWINGRKYQLRLYGPIEIYPNEYNEIVGRGKVQDIPSINRLLVEINWCNPIQCTSTLTYAELPADEYPITCATRTIYYPVTTTVTTTYTTTQTTTVTGPSTTTVTLTATVTETYTTTETIMYTYTTTYTYTYTDTITSTYSVTITNTTTETITKPAWPIEFYTCLGLDDLVYIHGTLDKQINKDAEYIPYIAKIYICRWGIWCSLQGIVPFQWSSNETFFAVYGPVNLGSFDTIKIEIWSIDVTTGQVLDLIHEEIVDTSVRCA